MIHITEKQTGNILDYIPLGDFWDDNHHKSLKDTLEFFEFRTFGDKRYSQHLEKMNRIIIPDEDGTFVEFVIFHAIKYRLQNTVVVDVYAPASYLLLKKAKVIKPQKLEGYTAAQHADFALAGTEWEVGRVDYAGIRTITIESHTNPYAYLKRIASEFDLELHFRVEVDGNKVIGRYVDLLERVGEWQGREVEFGRDLLGIERKVDDSNVVTALIGLGPERDDGTRLEVFVEDEEALQRWGIPNPQTGELMHLIETYEPESTDQDMTIERLTELTRNELEKRINSVVEYTADVADLEKVPGMENKKIRFGDTIKIKDIGFNPPLYLEARVHTQDRSLSQPEKKKITLGDYIEYTDEEVQAIWRQLQSEVRRRITAKQLYDYTYPKLVIDSKDDEVRTDVESYARTVAADAKNEAITYTNNTLEPIAVRVDNVEEDIKNHQELISEAQTDIIQAYNEIELRATKTEVDALSGRVSTVESTIRQHADMIESKIDDGQARSIFRQEASSFEFEASQINFKGHVFGEDATFKGHLEGASGTFGQVSVNDGDFSLRESSSGLEQSIIAKENLIMDHSFEMLVRHGEFDYNYFWYEYDFEREDNRRHAYWRNVGAPKIGVYLPSPDVNTVSFGMQNVCVNLNNYVYQVVDALKLEAGATYTISAFFRRQRNTTTGARPRIRLRFMNLLDEVVLWDGGITTFDAVPSNYNHVRYAKTFTLPKSLENEMDRINGLRIDLQTTDDKWVAVDGVQLVKGDKPVIYDPETSFFQLISGQLGYGFNGGIRFNNIAGAEFDKYGNLQAPRTASAQSTWNIIDFYGDFVFRVPWGTTKGLPVRINRELITTGVIYTPAVAFTSFTSPPLNREGIIWYGDGYRGRGLYVRDDVGWRKVQTT